MTSKTAPLPEERIAIIADMMRNLTWVRGKTADILAEQWGVSVKTVQGNASEASRIVRAEVMDPDEVRVDVGTALSMTLRNAVQDDDRATVIRAADVWATIAGAKAPARTENVNVDATATTPADAKRVMRELFGGVTPNAQSGSEEDAG